MRVDEKTVVPIGWVLGGFATMLSMTVVASFYIASVNFRLQRIEEKLGIPAYHASTSHSDDAFADEKHDVDAKRLLEPVRLLPANR